MTPTQLQNKIWTGYGKAASKLGQPHVQYRPVSAGAAIATANQLATLPAAFSIDANFRNVNKYGNAQWLALVDGTQIALGDYLVGAQTWFIAELDPLLPIKAVQCNRTISLARPPQETGVGALPYGGDTKGQETALITQWPASVLSESPRGQESEIRLPGDVTRPRWIVLLPPIPAGLGVTPELDDVITDDLGRRALINAAELTNFGWRLFAMQREV